MSPFIQTACIIDDDRTFIFVTSHHIKSNKLCEEVLSYENGQVAIDHLKARIKSQENFPEMILLDINMPSLDGWEFLEEFKKMKAMLPNAVRIYLASSSIDERDVERSKSYSEVSDYIVKPVRLDTLIKLFQKS